MNMFCLREEIGVGEFVSGVEVDGDFFEKEG